MFSKYANFNIIENYEETLENNEFIFEENVNSEGVSKYEFEREFVPYFIDKLTNMESNVDKKLENITYENDIKIDNKMTNYVTVNMLKNYVRSDKIGNLPSKEVVDNLNLEINKINEVMKNIDVGMDKTEIEEMIKSELEKIMSNTFVTRQQLKPEVFIPSYESLKINSTLLKNGCLTEYYNVFGDKFMNKFGSDILFSEDKQGIDYNFKNDNIVRDNFIGLIYLGNLLIPNDGVYSFMINSSGGCSFELYETNGTPNSILKGMKLVDSGNYKEDHIYLEKGYVPFRLKWFNTDVVKDCKLQLLWKLPKGKEFNIIPKSNFFIFNDNVPIKIPIVSSNNMSLQNIKKVKISGNNIHLHFEEIEVIDNMDVNVALNLMGGVVNVSSVKNNGEGAFVNNGIKGNHSYNIENQIYRGIVMDTNELKFNDIVNKLPIPFYIYRHSFSFSSESHNLIVYKRLTSLNGINMYNILFNTWTDGNNQLNTDFELYSNLQDAINGENRWEFCNFNNNGVGFPGYCGIEDENKTDWQSNTLRSQKAFNWYYVIMDEKYKNEGVKCCNYTNNGVNEYVEVLLRNPSDVKEIIIHNRPDMGKDACIGAKLELFDENDNLISNECYLNGDNRMYFTIN